MKKYLFILGLFLFPALTLASFSDLPGNHANFESVRYVQSEGIVSGYSDGTFKPDQTINRAELAKILVAANFGQELIDTCDTKSNSFSDVPQDAWFTPYVCIAKEAGVIGGYADGTFKPAQNVNFVEAAKMISLSFGQNDGATGEAWYVPFVDTLSNRNAIPTSISSFEKNITRGEMAEMVYRVKAKATKKESLVFANNQLSAAVKTIVPEESEVTNPIEKISDAQASCELTQGGVWTEFNNGCVDSCGLLDGTETVCTEALEYGCECGIDRCWNRATNSCVPNPSEKSTDNTPGQYLDLNSKDWDAALGNQMIVLFFHADWCPSCRTLDTEIKNRSLEIPTNSVIFKVDYDTETELRKQFGVTQQHTMVIINDAKSATLRKAGFSFQDLVDNL